MEELEQKVWWNYLDEDLQELLKTSVLLGQKGEELGEGIHDFSFIVFPAAKAYEGFLKKFFLDMGFITKEDYFGNRFRVGKALNPSLDRERYKGESVYDQIIESCQGQELANKLWETWKQSRNLIFHWFPDEKHAPTINEARDRYKMVIEAIDAAFKECKQNLSFRGKIR